MNNMEYKGYKGTVEYSSTDRVYYGKVKDIKSLVSYEGENIESLTIDFISAVEEYVQMIRKEKT